MAAYRATAEPNLWFAGAVTESPSEARLRRGAAYLERRQEEREARDRTYLAAAGMPGGGVAQRHSSRRAEEAAARVVVAGGYGGGGGGGGGEHLGLADPAATLRERAAAARARHDEASSAVAAVPPPPPEPDAHVLLTGAQLSWLAQQLLRLAPTQRDALRRRLPCDMLEQGWRCVPLALLDATGVTRGPRRTWQQAPAGAEWPPSLLTLILTLTLTLTLILTLTLTLTLT